MGIYNGAIRAGLIQVHEGFGGCYLSLWGVADGTNL